MSDLPTVKVRSDLYGLKDIKSDQLVYCIKDNTIFHLLNLSRRNKKDGWEQVAAFPQATNINATTIIVSGSGYLTKDYADARYAPISAFSAAEVLSKLLTVDGAGSMLDADFLDGNNSSFYAPIASPTFTGIVTTPDLIINNLTVGYIPYKVDVTNKLGDSPIFTDGTNVTVSGSVTGAKIISTDNLGFQNDVYAVNIPNPIWAFGNAVGYGLTYYQGTTLPIGDAIGFHFGDISAPKTSIDSSGNIRTTGNLTFTDARSINTITGNLTLSPAADLDLTPGGTARVRLTSGVRIQSDNYVSQTSGWGISYTGAGDFRYLYTDELHAKSFIADLEQALAGGQIISKSVAPLAAIFTVPAAGANSTLVVESFKGFELASVFVDGDIIRLRQFDRTGTSLNITNCWGTVVLTSTDTTNKTQTYTFTRSTGSNAGLATDGSTVGIGTLALDYGTSGNGFLESTAIDGAMAEYAPYHQIVSWTTHPATGQIVRTRLGNLKGIFNISNEYGLYAGSGVTDASQYLRISDQAIEGHNLTIKLYDGVNNTVLLSPTAPSFAMGSTLPTGYMIGNGIWMGKDTAYKMRVGSVSAGVLTEGFSWDNTTFTIKGTVTAILGYIGGWTIASTTLTGGNAVLSNTGVLTLGTGNDVVIISAADATYRLWAGNTNPVNAPFSVTKAGQLRVETIGDTIGNEALFFYTPNTTIYTGASGWNLNVAGTLTAQGLLTAVGVHIGGTTTPGTDNLLVDGIITAGGAFGCNGKVAQTPYVSSLSLSYTSGTYGFNTSTQLDNLVNTVAAIRQTLVANGIMSY